MTKKSAGTNTEQAESKLFIKSGVGQRQWLRFLSLLYTLRNKGPYGQRAEPIRQRYWTLSIFLNSKQSSPISYLTPRPENISANLSANPVTRLFCTTDTSSSSSWDCPHQDCRGVRWPSTRSFFGCRNHKPHKPGHLLTPIRKISGTWSFHSTSTQLIS